MLGRILRKGGPSSSSASSAFSKFKTQNSSEFPSNPFPVNPARPRGRKLDITFNERYMQGPRQVPVVTSLWQVKVKNNIRKAEYRRLPAEEKRKLYLESRPTKQKLLDWVGSKSRALVRMVGTVDAWVGPPIRKPLSAQINGNEVKLLGSGGGSARTGMSERAKRVMAFGMVVMLGGLMAALAVEKTRLEGVEEAENNMDSNTKGAVPLIQEEKEKRPGVFVWGSNRGDVTAPGSKDDFVKTATRLSYFDGRGLVDLALSNDLGVAVDEQGDVIQWGRAYSRTFVPEVTLRGKDITQVAISGDNVICLSRSGKVHILPASKRELESGPKPTESSWIPFWSSPSSVSYTSLHLPEKISFIASGDDHFILLSRSGKVYTVATTPDGNTFGQLGVETAANQPLLTPYPLTAFQDPVSQIAAGERHSLALTSRGDVYSWGSNAQGQLLQQFSKTKFTSPAPTMVPVQKLIPGIQGIQSIAAGGANSFIVTTVNGNIEVYASGSGMWGQLGSGVWNQIQHKPLRVKTIQGLAEWSEKLNRKVNIGVRYMTVGENHAAAVLDNDISGGIGGRDVFIWGCGEAYQLGHGKRNNLNVPSPHNPMAIAEGRLADLNAERFMLRPKRKIEITTAGGKKKNVYCEETIVFGGGCSAVFEKIVQ